jgi:hypothetical protein
MRLTRWVPQTNIRKTRRRNQQHQRAYVFFHDPAPLTRPQFVKYLTVVKALQAQ